MPSTADQSLFRPALRGIFAALTSDLLQKVLSIGSTLVILSNIAPYDYGLWQLILSVLTAFDVLLMSSIGSMLIADVSREIGAGEHARAGTIVKRSTPFFIVLGFLAAVLMVLAAPTIAHVSGIDLSFLLQIVALSLIGESISQCYQLVFQGTLALVGAQALKVLKRFGYVLGVIVLVFGYNLGISGLVYAYTFSIFLPLVLLFPSFIRRYRLLVRNIHPDSAPFIEAAWVRGRWSLGGDFVSATTGSITPWMIGYFLSVADVGFISLASTILGQVASLSPTSFILRSVLPRTLAIEGRTRAWLARAMKYAVWAQLAGGLLASSAVIIAVPLLFPSYVHVVPLVAALILALPIQAVGVVASEWFFASREQRSLFWVSHAPKLLLLALLPVALSQAGLIGYILWFYLSTDILTYLRLRFIGRAEGNPITFTEIVMPDPEDRVILGRVLDSVRKLGYTRT